MKMKPGFRCWRHGDDRQHCCGESGRPWVRGASLMTGKVSQSRWMRRVEGEGEGEEERDEARLGSLGDRRRKECRMIR